MIFHIPHKDVKSPTFFKRYVTFHHTKSRRREQYLTHISIFFRDPSPDAKSELRSSYPMATFTWLFLLVVKVLLRLCSVYTVTVHRAVMTYLASTSRTKILNVYTGFIWLKPRGMTSPPLIGNKFWPCLRGVPAAGPWLVMYTMLL